ncbi:MAG: hypothetical protein NW224_21535 [Leptolyngbyaceae cyanobacterium bins.302]|nr:hypothetical protein [Leptolyngbyaceae cyanobacterium bins.302]
MEFANIYLAFDQEVGRGCADSTPAPTAWARPIGSDRGSHAAKSAQPAYEYQAPTMPEADRDFELHSYPSFYL